MLILVNFKKSNMNATNVAVILQKNILYPRAMLLAARVVTKLPQYTIQRSVHFFTFLVQIVFNMSHMFYLNYSCH